MAEAWTWRAHYEDGTSADEKELGTFTRVERERCVMVSLHAARLFAQPVKIAVDPAAGEKIVCFRRNRVVVRMDGRVSEHQRLMIAGVEEPGGHNRYLVGYPDGSLRLVADLADLV